MRVIHPRARAAMQHTALAAATVVLAVETASTA